MRLAIPWIHQNGLHGHTQLCFNRRPHTHTHTHTLLLHSLYYSLVAVVYRQRIIATAAHAYVLSGSEDGLCALSVLSVSGQD
jgi:hypothetical protein